MLKTLTLITIMTVCLSFAFWRGMEKDLCYRAGQGEFTAQQITEMELECK